MASLAYKEAVERQDAQLAGGLGLAGPWSIVLVLRLCFVSGLGPCLGFVGFRLAFWASPLGSFVLCMQSCLLLSCAIHAFSIFFWSVEISKGLGSLGVKAMEIGVTGAVLSFRALSWLALYCNSYPDPNPNPNTNPNPRPP